MKIKIPKIVSRCRRWILLLFDMMCFVAIGIGYYLLASRAAHSMPVDDLGQYVFNSLVQFVFVFGLRFGFGCYRTVWRYTNTRAYFKLVLADGCGSILALLVLRLLLLYNGLWQAVVIGSLTALMALMSRFAYALLYKWLTKAPAGEKIKTPVAIVGAGRLGAYLAGDLRNNPNSGYLPVFFVDSDVAKVGNYVAGLKVVNDETARDLIEKQGIGEVIIAMANQDSETISRLYEFYLAQGCRIKVYESLIHDESATHRGVIRDFTIEDLLFRKPLDVAGSETLQYYQNKTVLVTGGGGSIGSELCRQIAACKPNRLIIFDIYENNAYSIQQELVRRWGKQLDLIVEIGSVRDYQRLEDVFRRHHPVVVFHAAAHKHVPLMEHSAGEAIKNNVMGTYNAAELAEKYGTEKFILISTDKAVNPTNVMGASKRVCEMVVQCRGDSKTSFAAVRFGNVLGSNGSVIPLFKEQIAAGGPVTITDKRIIRYFMTIPEASQLVMQAGAMAKRGEVFVLDMGKPVRIYDLAVNMIKLSGLEPEEDIKIEEIGLRPGEKLYEELLMQTEKLEKTGNDLIFIEQDTPYSRQEVEEKLQILNEAVEESRNLNENVGEPIRRAIAQVVPTYHDPEEINNAF